MGSVTCCYPLTTFLCLLGNFPSQSVLVPPLDVLKGAETERSCFDIRLESRKKCGVYWFSFEWFWPAVDVSSWGWALLALTFTTNSNEDQMNIPLILSSYSVSLPDFYFCFQQRGVHVFVFSFMSLSTSKTKVANTKQFQCHWLPLLQKKKKCISEMFLNLCPSCN